MHPSWPVALFGLLQEFYPGSVPPVRQIVWPDSDGSLPGTGTHQPATWARVRASGGRLAAAGRGRCRGRAGAVGPVKWGRAPAPLRTTR
ncbi:hypothetical protein Lfu02_78510 [Longispora fulva]|nr:hypothetical protein Lfu02_78510 [Longispora fulva]